MYQQKVTADSVNGLERHDSHVNYGVFQLTASWSGTDYYAWWVQICVWLLGIRTDTVGHVNTLTIYSNSRAYQK